MILSINTGSEKNSIAIFGGSVAKEVVWESYRTQSKELLPKIDKLLKSCKINPKDLEAIAVYQGPGSFTGLRVGISVANTLAWGLDVPVIGIKKSNKVISIRAIDIAQKAEKIYQKSKNKKFSKIVTPYYDSPLK